MPYNVPLIAWAVWLGHVAGNMLLWRDPLTGFDQQHLPLGHLGEAGGNHRARWATANDNEIVLVIRLRTKLQSEWKPLKGDIVGHKNVTMSVN